MQGSKFSNWEGGIRTNAFVSGGFVPQAMRGSTSTELIALWDWYATFAVLAGQNSSDPRAEAAGLPGVDSFDMWPMLSGANATNPRTHLLIGSAADTIGIAQSVQGTVVQVE